MDNVFINGIAQGSLKDGLDGLPDWATQKTAADIQAILKNSYNIQSKILIQLIKNETSGNGSPSNSKALNDALGKQLKAAEDEQKNNKKKKEWWTEEEKQEQRKKQAFNDLTKTFEYFNTNIKSAFLHNIQTFDLLDKSGINVMSGMSQLGDGFASLQSLTQITGVKYTDLAQSMTKFSSGVNAFGIGNFAKTIAATTGSMAKFGYSAKETGEILAEYLDIQQNISGAGNATEDDLLKFTKNITKLSIVTGMSRTAIMGNLAAITQSTEASILQGQTGKEAADTTLQFIASMKNQTFGKQLLKMMTDQIKPLNQTFMSFQKIGLGGFSQKLMSFTNSIKGLNPDEQREAMAAFTAQNENQLAFAEKQANLYSQVPDLAGEANSVLEFVRAMRQAKNETKIQTAKEKEEAVKLEATRASRANLMTQWDRLTASFQALFAPTAGMLDIATAGLKWFNDAIAGTAKIITTTFGENAINYIGFGIIVAGLGVTLYKFGAAITNIMKVMFSSVFGGKGGKGGPGSWTTSKGANGSGGKGGKGGPGSWTTSKGANGSGGVVGDNGSILERLAKGLSAMGTKQVLFGIANLAALGGVLWITGKALQEFMKLDWSSLGKAAVALSGLVLGMMAIGTIAEAGIIPLAGAVAVLAVLSATMWVLGKGIQTVGEGVDTFGKAFSSIGTGISDLSKSLSSFTGIDTLRAIISTINSIEITKVLAFAALSKMGGLSLPAPTSPTGVSVPTTPKSSTVNSVSSVSTADTTASSSKSTATEPAKAVASGIEKGPSDTGLVGMMSYQNNLLEQLLLSTKNLIAVNKDILRYTKVNS